MKTIMNNLEDSSASTYCTVLTNPISSNFSKTLSYVKPWSLDQLGVIQKNCPFKPRIPTIKATGSLLK